MSTDRAQGGAIGLLEVARTDFTELHYAGGTPRPYPMPIIGHTCELAYGWAVGRRANTDSGLDNGKTISAEKEGRKL
jgi:hypothetical protein